MIITVYNKQKDLALSVSSLKKMIPFLLKELDFATNEVIIHFVSKSRMECIHKDFFNDPSPTDCMSFPMDPPTKKLHEGIPHVLGEIFVCPRVAIEYAEEKELDPHEETTLYVVHGLLHLLGFDDLDPISRKKMRKMEKTCLEILKKFSLKTQKTCLKLIKSDLIS